MIEVADCRRRGIFDVVDVILSVLHLIFTEMSV